MSKTITLYEDKKIMIDVIIDRQLINQVFDRPYLRGTLYVLDAHGFKDTIGLIIGYNEKDLVNNAIDYLRRLEHSLRVGSLDAGMIKSFLDDYENSDKIIPQIFSSI